MAITSEDVPQKGGGTKKKSATEVIEEVKEHEDKQLIPEGKVLLKMERQNYSWQTTSGVLFTKEHPFQLVPQEEVLELTNQNFRVADPKEMVEFYKSA